MANPSSQPTIPVKKADGTTVKMTLDEFQAYKKGLAQQTQTENAAQPATISDITSEQDKAEVAQSQPQDIDFDVPPEKTSDDEKKLQIEKETEEKVDAEKTEKQDLPEQLEGEEKTELLDEPQTELLEEVSPADVSKEELAPESKPEPAPEQKTGEFEAMFEQLKEKPAEDQGQEEQLKRDRVEEVRQLLNNNATNEEGEPKQEKETVEPLQNATQTEEDQTPEEFDEEAVQNEKVATQAEEKQPTAAPASPATWQKEDHVSLLEDADDVEGTHAPVSSDAEKVVEQIMDDVSFLVPDDLQGRLKSLLVSRVKQVRNNDQVQEYATKSTDTGGLGMDDTQAQALLAAVSAYVHDGLQTPPTAQPRRAKSSSSAPDILQTQSENSQSESPAPTQEPPLTAFPEAPQVPSAPAPTSPPQQPQQTQQQASQPTPARMPKKMPLPVQQPAHKAVMHDVTPPAPKHSGLVGPVDEFHKFTLDDFRRLAAEPNAATERLKDKMEVLQHESYLLFEQARKAWFESPLFTQYHDLLVQSLNSRQSIRQVVEAQSASGLSEADVQALASFNQFLS